MSNERCHRTKTALWLAAAALVGWLLAGMVTLSAKNNRLTTELSGLLVDVAQLRAAANQDRAKLAQLRDTSLQNRVGIEQIRTIAVRNRTNIETLRAPRTPKIQVVADPVGELKREVDRRTFSSCTARIDFLMYIVNSCSLHCIDDWHNANWDDSDLVLSGIYQTYLGHEGQKPHLSCGPRSVALARILEGYGIQTRQIGIFSDKQSDLVGHNLLEVFNPDVQRWEAYDPTYDVHFRRVADASRAAVVDLVYGDLATIVPCSSDGARRGWDALHHVSLVSG